MIKINKTYWVTIHDGKPSSSITRQRIPICSVNGANLICTSIYFLNTALCFAKYRYAEKICWLGTRVSGGGAVLATGWHLLLIHEHFHDGEELPIHEYFHDSVELDVGIGQETHVDLLGQFLSVMGASRDLFALAESRRFFFTPPPDIRVLP